MVGKAMCTKHPVIDFTGRAAYNNKQQIRSASGEAGVTPALSRNCEIGQ
jgi:hypothetical protein